MIEIRPLQWSWSEWTDRLKTLDATRRALKKPAQAVALLSAVSAWQRDAIAYLKTLTLHQRDDVCDLLLAEIDMLWQVADPAAHAPSGYFPSPPTEEDRRDFRERFYVVQPLLALAEELHFTKASACRSALTDLETWTTVKRDWLP